VGVMERPQSTINDFYREMSALFGVNCHFSHAFTHLVFTPIHPGTAC
jgi:hypothetical protein